MNNFYVFLVAVSVALIVIFIYLYNDAKHYEDSPFSKFNKRLFNAFFNVNPDDTEKLKKQASKFGIKPVTFEKHNKILGKKPDYISVIMQRLYAIILILAGIALLLIGQIFEVSLLEISLIVILLAIVLFFYPTGSLKSKAVKKQTQIERDLVYFSDLFLTALKINLPVQTALLKTAQNYPCLLSEELLDINSKALTTQETWQNLILELSYKYDSKPLNEFASHIISGEETGTDIVRVVRETCDFLAKGNLTRAKNKAKKLNETILIPVGIFKLVPIIVLIVIPIINQASTMF